MDILQGTNLGRMSIINTQSYNFSPPQNPTLLRCKFQLDLNPARPVMHGYNDLFLITLFSEKQNILMATNITVQGLPYCSSRVSHNCPIQELPLAATSHLCQMLFWSGYADVLLVQESVDLQYKRLSVLLLCGCPQMCT